MSYKIYYQNTVVTSNSITQLQQAIVVRNIQPMSNRNI